MAAPTYTDVDGLGYILNGNPCATATGKNTYDTTNLSYIYLGNPIYGPVGPTGGGPTFQPAWAIGSNLIIGGVS